VGRQNGILVTGIENEIYGHFICVSQILNSTSDRHVTSQKQKLEKRRTLAFFPTVARRS
jgi:hypothetical protein